MLPDVRHHVSVSSRSDESLSNPESSFNHRTLAILVVAIGLVGTVLELAGPATVFPRLVLFVGALAAGVVGLVRVV